MFSALKPKTAHLSSCISVSVVAKKTSRLAFNRCRLFCETVHGTAIVGRGDGLVVLFINGTDYQVFLGQSPQLGSN